MTPIFSNNTKNLKSSVQNGTGTCVIEKKYLQWKPHVNRIKWRRVTSNQRNSNFPPHDHIWSKLGVFKREDNDCIRNGEKGNLHKIKNVVFLISHMWSYEAYFFTNTSSWRHNDVIRDEIRVIAPHMRNKKNYIFDFMQICLFSVANTFIVFAFKYP